MESSKTYILTEISSLTRTSKIFRRKPLDIAAWRNNHALGINELEDYRNTLKELIAGYENKHK